MVSFGPCTEVASITPSSSTSPSQDAGPSALSSTGKVYDLAATGFALLTVSYLWNANIYLVNPVTRMP